MAVSYQHDQLAEGSFIRILYLHPTEEPKDPLKCSLVSCALSQGESLACEYEALSYVWGSAVGHHPLEVGDNAETLLITRNCETALRHLRLREQKRALWVDSICINQGSISEKDHQVKLMGAIYRQASSVRVWVGPLDSDDGTNGDEFAIENLKAICSLGAQNTLSPPLRGWGATRIGQLNRFFGRSWWERMWVVQEVALGRHVVFQQGPKELEYKTLLTAYRAVDAYVKEISEGFRHGFYNEELGTLMQVLESVKILDLTRKLLGADSAKDVKTPTREDIMTWTTIANMLRSRKASIPSDKLYSLFGLLPLSEFRNLAIEQSYSLMTEEAFIKATYSIMKSSECFMMFNFVARRPSDGSAGLPSWVPDWRLAPENQYEANLRVAREKLYNASNNTSFHLQRLSSNTICLKGFFVDVVQARDLSLTPTTVWILQVCYSDWRKTWAHTRPGNAMPEHHTYMDGTSADTAFRRTVLWDCELGAEEGALNRLTQEEAASMFEAYDRVANMSRQGRDLDNTGQKPSVLDTRRAAYMVNCVKERAFFVTATQLIGITQSNVKLGDHIFIAAGNSHPIILRPSKKYADTWHAVGECYLHGFMDGLGVMNMEFCATVEKAVCADPAVQAMKGTEKNPRWDEITDRPDGLWKWLLIE